VLAVLTLGALLLTLKSLNQTQTEIALSRREVEEAHRPVLVPVLDVTRQMQLPNGEVGPATPTVPGNRILVPVENIGSGPALQVEMGLAFRSERVAVAHRGEHTMMATGIGVGHLTSLELPLAGAVLSPFDIRLTYLDVVGKSWVTTARFEMGMAYRYEGLSITSTDA
jgi:hypothetical protein